jgi:predicted transcriptional regulator
MNRHRTPRAVSPRKELKFFGFRKSLRTRFGAWCLLVLTAVAAVIAAELAVNVSGASSALQAATAVVAFGALVGGYFQWQAVRNETSIERYYDRLELADHRLDAWPAARALFLCPSACEGKQEDASYQRCMYVYVELDNLEYAIEKYKVGYMSADTALRALRTFQSRCTSEEFRKIARQSVPTAGYHTSTVEVVSNVLREIEPTQHIGPIFPSHQPTERAKVLNSLAEKSQPDVSIETSVHPEYIVCLEDGQHVRTLKRHLQCAHRMTPQQYREKWKLPNGYPMVAPVYSAQRSRMAKESGFGRVQAHIGKARKVCAIDGDG